MDAEVPALPRRAPARVVRTALALVAVAAVLAGAFAARGRRGMMADFEVNRTAARRLLLAETPYRTADRHWQFKYPPVAAIIYLPLVPLTDVAARAAWFVVVAAAVAAVFVLAYRKVLPRDIRPAVRIAAGVVLARYFLREMELGQVNAIIAAMLLGAVALLETPAGDAARNRRREAAAGLLWAAACGLKPYALAFAPYWVLRREWRTLAWGAAAFPAMFIAPALFYGLSGNWTVHKEWMSSLSASTPPLMASQDNVSLAGFFAKHLGGPGPAAFPYLLAAGILVLVILAVVLKGRRAVGTMPLEASLILLAIPLVSPLGWDYTFLSALPAVALVLARMRSFPLSVRVLLAADMAVIALTLYDVLGRRLYATFMSWSVITVCFMGLAAAVAALRWTRSA